jgi:hypothetical protein
MGLPVPLFGGHHAASAVVWVLAFMTWLYGYWPPLRCPAAAGRRAC